MQCCIGQSLICRSRTAAPSGSRQEDPGGDRQPQVPDLLRRVAAGQIHQRTQGATRAGHSPQCSGALASSVCVLSDAFVVVAGCGTAGEAQDLQTERSRGLGVLRRPCRKPLVFESPCRLLLFAIACVADLISHLIVSHGFSLPVRVAVCTCGCMRCAPRLSRFDSDRCKDPHSPKLGGFARNAAQPTVTRLNAAQKHVMIIQRMCRSRCACPRPLRVQMLRRARGDVTTRTTARIRVPVHIASRSRARVERLISLQRGESSRCAVELE